MIKQIGRFFVGFIPSGLLTPILRGPLTGCKWIVGSAAGEGKGLSIIFNLSEPKQLEMTLKVAKPDFICFDIGANVGLYTLMFSQISKHVYAFEPLPRNISYLYRTLAVNHVDNATIVPFAVSDSISLSSFMEGENCAIGMLDNKGKIPTITVSLDDFISTYKVVPQILKIDVEGAEMSVLMGAKNLLMTSLPIIFLSTHGEINRNKCLEFLLDVGYNHIIPLNSKLMDNASEYLVMNREIE